MRTKNKNVTPVDSDSFFFITFQSWENLVENKLETSIRSAQPSKKKKNGHQCFRETCLTKRAFEKEIWAGTYRLLQKPASTLIVLDCI